MLFTSVEFLCLFLITLVVYYQTSLVRIQVQILILASLVFYGWNSPELLLLLAGSIGINSATSYLTSQTTGPQRLTWAIIGVVTNLLVLVFFKYGQLLADLGRNFLELPVNGIVGSLLTLPLPVGISFYTFEGISLVVDVYKGKLGPPLKDEKSTGSIWKHISKSTLFIAFFPHLVAGPILKAGHFYPQIGPKSIGNVPWAALIRTLITGCFLKCFVADNLKDYTFWLTYPYCIDLGLKTSALLLFAYSMQIFADFAGYSLIAIGLAAMLGYELPVNFNYPYLASSLSDFWRRWHISLSTWLRDYLYIPLGGNRRGEARTALNLMLVMSLGGLWHGANWTYLIWGAYHGAGLVLEKWLSQALSRTLPTGAVQHPFARLILLPCRIVMIFGFVTLGWLLFKIHDFNHLVHFMTTLASAESPPLNKSLLLTVACYSAPVIIYHLANQPQVRQVANKACLMRGGSISLIKDACYAIMIVCLILNRGDSNEFIYFQF